MKKFALGLAVAVATLASVVITTAPAVAAVLVTVGGQHYDVDVLPAGSFTSNQSLLQSQPWWGNEQLASYFAIEVNTSLGVPNLLGFPVGPYFAWSSNLGEVARVGFSPFFDAIFGDGILSTLGSVEEISSFAVATVVPEPLTIIGSITAAGFGVAFKKRKKDSNKV